MKGSTKWPTWPSAGRTEGGAARGKDPEHTGLVIMGSADQQHCRLGSCWRCRVSGLVNLQNQNPHVNTLNSESYTCESLRSTDERPFKPHKDVEFY